MNKQYMVLGRVFNSLAEAADFANDFFEMTGVIVAIEEVK